MRSQMSIQILFSSFVAQLLKIIRSKQMYAEFDISPIIVRVAKLRNRQRDTVIYSVLFLVWLASLTRHLT